MLKSSLLEILRTFSKQELIKFEDLVRSSYFNKKENVLNLLLVIKRYAPSFESKDLEKENVWQKLFSGKKYNYGIMKNIIHDLTGLSEQFILLEHYSRDSFRSEYDLIEAANDRNIQSYTSKKIGQFEKRVEKEIAPDRYSIIEDLLYVSGNFNYAKSSFIHEYDLKSGREESLRLAAENLLFYFLITSFKLIHNAHAHEVQGNRLSERTILEKLFLKLKETSVLDDLLTDESRKEDKLSRIVYCFYLMYKALTSDGDPGEYDRYKTYLRNNVELFSSFELQNLNNCRITCAIKLRSPNTSNARESLDWYKFLMERNILLQRNGLITVSTMSNLVRYALNLNESALAEEFLMRYSRKLPEDSRDNTFQYCMAMIHFSRGEFGKSLECLTRIKDEKLLRKYFVKKLQLKVFYELNEYDSFLYAFDSFAHFKKRNKLPNDARVVAFNNFGNGIKRLFKLRNSFEKYESEKFRRDVLISSTGERSWFIQKINEIEHRMK